MISDWLFVVTGMALLLAGGEALVRGASGIALLGRVSASVVGLTIVAAGTSMPEMVVSVQSSLEGRPGLALGNAVGSNIFNIGVILGVTALVQPLRIRGNSVRLEWPVMLLAAMQVHLLSRDGGLDRLEGAFLLAGMAAFTAYIVWASRVAGIAAGEGEGMETASFGKTGTKAWVLNASAVALGVGLLAGGSSLLVRGAVAVAASLGISESVIGLTIVAAGTSMPELVTSLVAAWRGKDDIAVANVIGSNIFNMLGILGTASLIQPLTTPPEILARDDLWMIGFSVALLPLMKSGLRISRGEGAALLAAFGLYLAILLGAV
ncbi:MAG: calcium/sodium antiporter [Myxococcales bacterium]|nr:calcium/sodium antiporter [Myxococcales bacterium]